MNKKPRGGASIRKLSSGKFQVKWREYPDGVEKQNARNFASEDEAKAFQAKLLKIRPNLDREVYRQMMETKFAAVDISAIAPPVHVTTDHISLSQIFVPQYVKNSPPESAISRGLVLEHAERSGAELSVEEESYAAQLPESILAAFSSSNDHLVILGPPGSGKSSACRFLLLASLGVMRPDSSIETARTWDTAIQRVPILVNLADFDEARQANPDDSLLEYIQKLSDREGHGFSKDGVQTVMEEEDVLLILDGLDEILDPKRRHQTMQMINLVGQRYKKCRIIVTSRPIGFSSGFSRALPFQLLAIQGFDDRQIDKFLDVFLMASSTTALTERRKERCWEAFKQHPGLRSLAGNPMLLTTIALVATVYDLPFERWRIYSYVVDVLCHHWDVNRFIEDESIRFVSLDDKREIFEEVVTLMSKDDDDTAASDRDLLHPINRIETRKLEKYLREFFHKNWGLSKQKCIRHAQSLLRQLSERNYLLCHHTDSELGFVHESLLAYFYAESILKKFHLEKYGLDFLKEQVTCLWRNPFGREAVRLVFSQLDRRDPNKEQLLSYIIGELDPAWLIADTAPENLLFALECLSELSTLHPIREHCARILRLLILYVDQAPVNARDFIQNRLFEVVNRIGRRWPSTDWIYNHIQSCAFLQHSIQASGWLPLAASLIAAHGSEEQRRKLRRFLRFMAHFGGDPEADNVGEMRAKALEALGIGWPDDHDTTRMIERFANESDDEQIRATAFKYLRHGSSQVFEMLVAYARQDRSERVRCVAIEELKRRYPRETETTRRIGEATSDVHESVRLTAIKTLVSLAASSDATRKIIEARALHDSNPDVRIEAIKRIGYGTSGWDVLENCLLNEERYPEIRAAAAKRIVEEFSDDDDNIELLIKRLAIDGEAVVRETIVTQLAKANSSFIANHFASFATVLRNRTVQDSVRAAILKAFANCDLLLSRQVLDEAESLSHESSPTLQLASIWAMSELGHADPLRIQRVADMIPQTKDDFANGDSVSDDSTTDDWSESLSDQAIEFLVSQLELVPIALDKLVGIARFAAKSRDRLQAIEAIVKFIERGQQADKLIDLVGERAREDPDNEIRMECVRAIASLFIAGAGSEKTRSILREGCAKDHSDLVRKICLEALVSLFPDRETWKFVRGVARNDKSKFVRRIALSVLASNFGDKRGQYEEFNKRLDVEIENSRNEAEQEQLRSVAKACIQILVNMWPDLVRSTRLLETLMKDKDLPKQTKVAVVQVFTSLQVEQDSAFNVLKEWAMNEKDAEVKIGALHSIANLWPESMNAFESLSSSLEDPSSEVAAQAARLLVSFQYPDLIQDKLRKVAQTDSRPAVRLAAVKALGAMSIDVEFFSSIAESDSQSDVRSEAFGILLRDRSQFAKVLFSFQGNGKAPWRDPSTGVDENDIHEAAGKLQITENSRIVEEIKEIKEILTLPIIRTLPDQIEISSK